MPYKVGSSDKCPDTKPHSVMRDDGSVVPGGCHESREKALAHQRALMANVPDAKSDTSERTASLFETELPVSFRERLERVADRPSD